MMDRQEMADMVREAQELIAQAAQMLDEVARKSRDEYRRCTIVATLKTMAGTGGWLHLDSETLESWIKEIEEGEDEQ